MSAQSGTQRIDKEPIGNRELLALLQSRRANDRYVSSTNSIRFRDRCSTGVIDSRNDLCVAENYTYAYTRMRVRVYTYR